MAEENVDLTRDAVAPPPARPGSLHQSRGHLSLATDASPEDVLKQLLEAPFEALMPWEDCMLPSRGRYYGWDNDGVIRVHAMTQAAEKLLVNQRLVQSGQAIDKLFDACCQFPAGFDSTQLLLGDRNFLLYFLRGITHGNDYEFMMTCPHCAAQSQHQYDLNDLVSSVQLAEPGLGVEPFTVELPSLSQTAGRRIWVGVRFLRAADTNVMLSRRRTQRKAGAAGPTVRQRGRGAPAAPPPADLDGLVTETIERSIVSVMGLTDPFQIRAFVERLPATDAAVIREWLNDHSPGIDATVEVTCTECNVAATVQLPVTESFFRPTKRRRA